MNHGGRDCDWDHGLWVAGADDEPGWWPGPDGLVIYLGVPVLLTLLGRRDGGVAGWLEDWLQNAMVGVCIGGVIELMYRFFWPAVVRRPPSWVVRALGHLTTVAVGVVVGGELATRVFALGWGLPVGAVRESVWRAGFVVSLAVVGVSLVYDGQRARAARAEQAAQAARLATMRAQLDALVARVNPHFLFNSLNSVAALIADDPARAEAMLERLAGLFRYALEGARRREVTLGEEVGFARDYLEVEGIRLGERLRARVEVEPGLDGLAVPPLSLQPLVENAIVHGVAPRRGPGTVDVKVRRDGDVLEIVVDDDGETGGVGGGARSALADLRQRLALLHGDAGVLEAGPGPTGVGWRARVRLPARGLA